jgi:histidinol-phosphate aminotransferase
MTNIKHLIRPNILNLEPYTCARNEFSGKALAWIDANENSRINGFNRYPDPLQLDVKKKIAEIRGIAMENIFLGVGSDECIDISYRVFCRPGIDNVVAIEPTYGMYKVCADINDIEYRAVELIPESFELNTQALLDACDENTKIMWICSPNNPTANAFPLSDIRFLCENFNGIIIIDEAYIDFSSIGSMTQLLEKYPQMIVMQTLSKAWAAAAIRLGIAFASPFIINIFNNVKYPYNINILTQQKAIEILSNFRQVRDIAAELVDARNHLAAELVMLDCVEHVYPSDANFLLVKVNDADKIYAYLKGRGIIVRNRSKVKNCANCLRITVGSILENQLLINTLHEYDSLRR